MSNSMSIAQFKTMFTGSLPGQVIWAVTNLCNAGCSFCSYPKGKGGPVKHVSFDDAKKVLDLLYDKNIRIISFTGGEPLLNPDIYEIIKYASAKGFFTRTGTNGAVLNYKTIRKLKDSGVRNVWISIDSEIEKQHDSNRGIPGLMKHIRNMIPLMKEIGINVNAAAPINRLIRDYYAFAKHIRSLGLDTIAFCYPMTVMAASYGGAAASDLVELTPDELIETLGHIEKIKLSKYEGIRIVNPIAGLQEMVRFQKGNPPLFPCLGGYKFFYLDWNLTLYRCAFLSENFGNILDLGNRQFHPTSCNQCMWQCFRDPSILYHLPGLIHPKEPANAWQLGLKNLVDKRASQSLTAWFDLIKNNFYA
ncbi:MAG TPA: radical SAM protein [Methylomusa anaerophila]|uniref:Antilisterial bacteriocin subtilosin biosynthesis protein AlbA n=1 Tax=Methylomusa anaerophila TaxID=1930071 RepID=A0A348ALY8_9FIRM|nr:radical SAM protein [Methylomusa anaerophila]BBB92086.1 antilisterial bacteriocin subtilosin biosynthesis protein AlbA [Methylomusa anaerophila]HML87901.1 radical SAM protein [Methylomusa anaerophila]